MYRIWCNFISVVAVAILISGCEMETAVDLEANKELVRQFIAETDAKNFAAYNELWTDDVVAHFPNGVDMDRQTVEENERMFAIAFPDASRSIDQLLAEGDRVILRETLRGTHLGPFGDLPPTGKQIEVTANVIYRIEDGKIAESWVEADLGTFVSGLADSESAE
jgi:predicted ester cyclase